MRSAPTALIADDEPLLREALAGLLAKAWPELRLVDFARNGREAIELVQALRPDIVFLDVHMPGLNGIEAAQRIVQLGAPQPLLVFVTAFENYALQAFERGAHDYLVKPVEPERLAQTVQRLQERLRQAKNLSAQPLLAELEQLAGHLRAQGQGDLQPAQAAVPLRWIRASVGPLLRLIPVDEIDFLRSDEKYTLVAWRGDGTQPGEALIRTPLKELLAQLDPELFVQVHRSVVVNLSRISHVVRSLNETADIHLKGRSEVLPVSRSYLHRFRQM